MLTIIIIAYTRKYLSGFITDNASSFKKVRIFLLLLCISVIPKNALSQPNEYTVLKGNKKIGKLITRMEKSLNTTSYSVWSEAETSFLISIRVNIIIDEIFSASGMEKSTFTRKINDRETINNSVIRVNKRYILADDDGKIQSMNRVIDYSMAAMYFIEPVNKDSVYSESYQSFVPIIEKGYNNYLVVFPDGNKSYYSYKNGKCISIKAHTRLAVLQFTLNEPGSSGFVMRLR